MDLDGKNTSQENIDSKGAFRKLSNDAVNRKYRRRTPVGGSSSSDGSPARKRSSSPIPSRKDDWRHKDDYIDRGSSRNRQDRSGESQRQSDRQSSRSSRNYHKQNDYTRYGRHTDDDDKGYSKLSSHSHHDSRVDNYGNNSRRDNDHRSRHSPRDTDKHYRDRYGDSAHRSKNQEREASSFKDKDLSFDRVGSGRRYNSSSIDDNRSRESDRYKEYRDSRDEKGNRSSDHKSDRSPAYEESRSNRNESNSRKEPQVDAMELDGKKYTKEERKNYEDREKIFADRNVASSKGRVSSPSKKSKFSGMDESSAQGKDANAADGKFSSNSKQGQDLNGELSLEQGVKDSDIDAAKIAAMKAAELVNRNLIGTGIMTTDQKKKLLWGNKKTTTNSEESTHRWDTSLFGDRDRQEKFNKLMSLRLPWCLWPIVGCERRRANGEQTCHPRCREAKGTSNGLREAIHCWTSPKRRSYSWTRSLRTCLEHLCILMTLLVVVLCCLQLWSCMYCVDLNNVS
ncbi:uncharacterized protein [Solanum lycopersicum]|uniref:uncharacterized protein isoform X1 n=1 Tax=Solanum lycopersicum TaxID=4081 RepID=UPI0002BC975D|nr:arginine/serine-rich coiled-coil protein 2 isoform X1 [Solanum lycopersicum]